MKGDFSRLTFNPTRHYSGVRMQQGRVQLDADWNEQMDILLHRFETEVNDFIGRSGVPADYNGGTSFRVTSTADGDLLVAPGRYYIAGKLFQNDASVRLPKEQLPTEPGQYVAYLDAWQSHVTPLEDPTLREVALGGADTATRIQHVWQVRFQKTDARPDLDWQPAGVVSLSTGTMRARVAVGGATLENQLYRVEIHQSGVPTMATWKWSRDNGSIAATITSITGKTVNISSTGRDPQSSFAARQWVELSTVAQAQRSDPGFLVPLDAVQGTELTLTEPPPDDTPFTIIRRWDSAGALPLRPAGANGDGWILLENDIQVQFDRQPDRVYNAGDYWQFPARTIPGDIEWPRDSTATPLPQPPHGVRHDYVALAFLQLKDDTWSLVDAESDLRVQFPALDKGFVSKEGDTIRGSLHIGGAGDPSKALTVNGATTLQGDLTVTGTTDLGGNTRIGTDQQAGNLDVKGVLSIGGTMASDASPLTITKSATDFAHVRFAGNDMGQLEIVGWSSGWNINAKTDGKHLYLNRDASAASNVLIGRQNRELYIRGNDGNVGIGTANPVARLDIAQTARTGNGHPTAVKGLYVTGDFGASNDGVEFRHTNGTQGIGLGYSTIYATGSNADQPLNLQPRGKGEIGIGGDMRLKNHALLLRDGADLNHGLAWFGEGQQFASTAPDGPVVFGYAGGGLGTRQKTDGTMQEQIALQWHSSGQLTANGDLEFAPTAQAKILWNSKVNTGSDRAFVLFKDNSTYLSPQGTAQECARLSIGVFNDFGNIAADLDALDIQGGTRLTLNVGAWDAELNTAIGTPATGDLLQGISFRINDVEKMQLDKDGKLGITASLGVGPFTLPTASGRFCVTGSLAEIGFAKRTLTTWPASPQKGDRFLWYNSDGTARLWTEAIGDLLSVDADGNITIRGRIGNYGHSPTPRTSGWGGGIHTFDLEAEGTVWSHGPVQTGARDLAENYAADVALEAGDVVSLALDSDHIVPAATPNDTRVIGVVSTIPGFLLNAPRPQVEASVFPVALCGRVPCKVVDENGPITRGDLLTASSRPGYAMKAVPMVVDGQAIFRPGSILGKALTPLESGQGTIEIFVTRG
jgi:hypothetical protein